MSNIFHMNMANLFVGDDDPSNSLFLTIKNVKLPTFEETTKDHAGGGASGKVQLGMGLIEPLMPSFQLEGFNPGVQQHFMPAAGRIKYTIRGNVYDLREQTDLELKAIIQGRLTKMEMGEFTRDAGMTEDYEIKEALFYSISLGGQEKFYFDYFSGPAGFRVNGQVVQQRAARNLGLV